MCLPSSPKFTSLLFAFYIFLAIPLSLSAQPINRKAVVERHTIKVNSFDSLQSLSVGNGAFAFTVDATGLQSFPALYAKGISLGTQSEWGWHSFPNTAGYREEEALRPYDFHNRKVTYSVQWNSGGRSKEAADYFRSNLHRLQLGNLGFEIKKKNGEPAVVADVKAVVQTLNMWTGEIHSRFTVEGVPVEVWTYGHPDLDAISVRVQSSLLQQGRIKVRVRFPYPTGAWEETGNNWTDADKHHSAIVQQHHTGGLLQHRLDTTSYVVAMQWSAGARVNEKSPHYYLVNPASGTSSFELTALFAPQAPKTALPPFAATAEESSQAWTAFWNRGAAVDFAGSTDNRAMELERRIITSQYLTRIQCAGSQPPQETGLTYNSWFGKPHLEMHWWHGVHFALWGRPELLEKSMAWYAKAAPTAFAIAKRQGYAGLRWQKVTDPDGREVPSSVGAMLIWQQPHFIYFSELLYRAKKDKATLDKYKELVFATADFMASYAWYDSATKRYILGKGLIPAQERFKPEETFNPTYELAYWNWALQTAQIWRQRLGLPRQEKWDAVLRQLSPLPVQNGLYLAAESATDSYTNPVYRTDHPSVLATLGTLPELPMTNKATMQQTFNWVWDNWTWRDTWGWDFPMVAMTATRLGNPEKAMDALLMPVQTNTYLVSGHNYQDERLRLYLPGNGGLLAAVALMCGGYDGAPVQQPGIPKNGKWKVRCEGFMPMP